ncbi:YSC84-related protein [Falsirhodobacter algicola]|uniref:Twin-arginine translocation signal domain-containing protein n=1 Tax=Falsirhodobacter algicola TaxID=2692330 RepID=A0A8J8SK36_9RHOB|nr:YSC84-related protein [Falsirhodobacter algicola]QUS35470.1 twin-arginine translocation signal domain-containing protein [Falsirhodobacter algicola]
MLNRRNFLAASGVTLALGACANGVNSSGGAMIDARVDVARDYLFQQYPGTRDLADRSAGVLFMPLITEAGLGIGGAYGRGALRINGATVDYYSAAKATVGFQIGAQQYAHALFFMTPASLAEFRSSSGWVAGADLRYAVPEQGGSIGKDTTEINPVIALVYGQSGLIAGATVAGTKYTRIIP